MVSECQAPADYTVNIRESTDVYAALQDARLQDQAAKLLASRKNRRIFLETHEVTGEGEIIKNMYDEKGFLLEKAFGIRPTGHKVDDVRIMPKIDDIKFNGTTTIVFWKDDSKTVVKCHPDDVFVPYIGVAIAHMKRQYGAEWARMHHIRKAVRDAV